MKLAHNYPKHFFSSRIKRCASIIAVRSRNAIAKKYITYRKATRAGPGKDKYSYCDIFPHIPLMGNQAHTVFFFQKLSLSVIIFQQFLYSYFYKYFNKQVQIKSNLYISDISSQKYFVAAFSCLKLFNVVFLKYTTQKCLLMNYCEEELMLNSSLDRKILLILSIKWYRRSARLTCVPTYKYYKRQRKRILNFAHE